MIFTVTRFVSGESKGQVGDEVDCLEFSSLVVLYVDCTVPLEQLRDFYVHASECEECRTYLLRYRISIVLLKEEGEKT